MLKNRKVLVFVLTILFVFSASSLVYAKSNETSETVSPMWINFGEYNLYYSGQAYNSPVYSEGTFDLYSPVIADGYLEMLLSGSFQQPTIIAKSGVPAINFDYRYDSAWGGQCWAYDSGRIWYKGSKILYLKARAQPTVTQIYQGMFGSNGYIPDYWITDYIWY